MTDNLSQQKDKKFEKIKAFDIGLICITSYLCTYVVRHLLSVYNPELTGEGGILTATQTATLSSVYMIVYAIGQLLNGSIGDYVKPKFMGLIGLSIGGFSLLGFAFINSFVFKIILYGLMGFGLSMLRGPLVRVISENSLPAYARIACMFFSFVSVFGTFVASILSTVFNYKTGYIICGMFALIMAVFCFFGITLLEKKGYVKTVNKPKYERKFSDFFAVFKLDRFTFFIFINVVVEISATAITHWLTLYLTEGLNFSNEVSTFIYSGISLFRAFCSFLSLILFRLSKYNDIRVMRIMFLCSFLLFAGVFFVKVSVINVICLLLALMCISISSALVWSVYIPSLGSTGHVSSANGTLDCVGYFGAAGVQMIFTLVYENFSWTGMVISWGAVALLGFIISLFGKKTKNVTIK